jgi:hypothetical protein
MSGEGGFFMYDGTVKMLPCLVEDFVFTTSGDNLGINYASNQLVYCAEHNTLYNEINWFYPKAGSTQIDRSVTYNYGEDCWTTSSLARSSYADQGVFDLPYATDYNSTATPNFPTILGITINMEHQLIMLMKPEPIKLEMVPLHLLMLTFNLVILI